MERCTRGAKVVAKLFLERVDILLSPLSRDRRQQNTLAWVRTTRSGALSLLVDSVACAVAVRVVDEVEKFLFLTSVLPSSPLFVLFMCAELLELKIFSFKNFARSKSFLYF